MFRFTSVRCVSRPAALCSMTTRVVSTGIASNTPPVVCAPPQDSATRAAAVCRMPTRSPTRPETIPIGISRIAIRRPITRALATNGGIQRRRSDMSIFLPE
jgi:hypothetical protein